jgi:hypothetical protein
LLKNDLASTLSLDSPWDFALGKDTPWGQIQVPGCWEAQGYPKTIDGPARYRRQVFIPNEWTGQRVFIEFDAVSYACTVRLNDVEVGQHRGLWTPFAVDVTRTARFGRPNTLELEVYKPGERYPMRSCLAGFLPDVATAFGGIWQPARLVAMTAGLEDLHIATDPDTGRLRVRCRVAAFEELRDADLKIKVTREGQVVAADTVPVGAQGCVDATVAVPGVVLWRPERPALYRVRLQLHENGRLLAQASERVGFRRLAVEGEQLLVNGEPACLRGALSWGWDPDRIAPAYTAEQARDEMRRLRALGFNLIKLCLFVPNQTCFDVADEEGMLLWQEWPMWLPEISGELRVGAVAEYADFMRLTRHHPSVVLYSLGCELGRAVDESLLRQLNDVVRGSVSDVLFCDNSGSGEAYEGLDVDFADFSDYHTYCDLNFLEPMLDHWRRDWKRPRPWLFGEFCDSDGFRDLAEIIAANRGEKPWWMSVDIPIHSWRPEVRALLEEPERLERAALGFTPQELTRIANAQSLVVRKYTLETVRRRDQVKGYVITGLRDTPLATSGIFDDLGQPKWTPEAFRPFNDDAILCLDVGRRRQWQHGGDRPEPLDPYNWWAGDRVRLHVILNHVGKQVSAGSQLGWRVTHLDGRPVAEGAATLVEAIPPGHPREIGTVEFRLPPVERAEELRLEARLSPDPKMGLWGDPLDCPPAACVTSAVAANYWPLWCYPRPARWPADLAVYDPPALLDDLAQQLQLRRITDIGARGFAASLVISSVLDSALQRYLRGGGKALLLQHGAGPLPTRRVPFWREAIKLFPPHPLWQAFPQRGYADLQFFGVATDVALDAARLKGALPDLAAVRPIMRRLDAREFHVTEYLVEAQVGRGRLLACTLRLAGGYGAQPAGIGRNVAGHYLLWALADYLASCGVAHWDRISASSEDAA